MITASVVLYKTPVEDVKNIIRSYAPSDDRRLFFIDNSPEKNEEYAFLAGTGGVEYLFNGKNMGYGRANNIGIRKALELGSDYHVVMNPDITFSPEIIDEMAQYADSHPDVVYMMPQIVDVNGVVQPLCKLLPTPADLIARRFLPIVGSLKRRNDRYILADFGYGRIINPPCLSGCFMFLRTETLRASDIEFDERFFLYCEDFDIIRRLHRVGQTIYYPEVTAAHREMKESYSNLKMLSVHIVSAFRYFNKYGWFHDPERREMNGRILSELGID